MIPRRMSVVLSQQKMPELPRERFSASWSISSPLPSVGSFARWSLGPVCFVERVQVGGIACLPFAWTLLEGYVRSLRE